MHDPFIPRNLTGEQLDQLYADADTQAEAQEAAAWMNFVRARAAREAVRADWERVREATPARPEAIGI